MYDIGKTWPKWKIQRVLGEGSFGKVYEIYRNEFGIEEHSALKIVSIPQNSGEVQSLRNDGMTEMETTEYFKGIVKDFVKEIKVMSQLKGHSNIVAYEDFEVIEKTDSIGFEILIRMELLTAFPQYLQENSFRVLDVVRLGIDICKALEVCRELSIVHRDIKPDNIFVSATGSFKLGDFGVARTIEKSVAGMSRKGTYSYMAPEIYNGKDYGFEADIYSLGIVLYKLLNNNRDPFLPPHPTPIKYEDKMEALMKRLQGMDLPRPVNADDRLAAVILKATAFDPTLRYRHPTELREDLEAIAAGYRALENEAFSESSIHYYTNQSLFTYGQSSVQTQNQSAEPTKDEQSVVCAACGAKLKEGAKFCGICGQPMTPPAAPDVAAVQETTVAPEVTAQPETPVMQETTIIAEIPVAPEAPAEPEIQAEPAVPAEPEVEAEQPQEMQVLQTICCGACGSELKLGAKFCSTCGQPWEQPEQSVQCCVACGAELKAGAKFCSKCGHAQVQAQPVVQIQCCTVCGAELKPGAKFCGKCGQPQGEKPLSQGFCCSACGAALKPGAKFCGKCGNQI